MTGQTISHYRILEKLGEGGMGVVYKAEDTKLKRTVALKFLPPDALGDPDLRTRFCQEAQAAAALSHPNVCTVYEIDEERGFLAMEFIDGETAQAWARRRPLPMPEALDIAMQAAQGLQAAHEKGVVHRDVKSANLMVTPSGAVKIMDFGLARLTGRTRVTRTGTALGTPAYMSPEQAQGKAVDRRSDLWSLGVVLYEMVAGQLPFRGDSEAAVVYSILHDDPEPVTGLRAGLPLELDRVIAKVLAKDPGERYQHAEDLLVDLKRVKRDAESGRTASRNVAAAGWRRWWVPALASAAVAIAALGWYLATRRGGEVSLKNATFTRLTTLPSEELYPSLSPDGKSFVYQSRAAGNWDVYLQRVGGKNPINLTKDSPADDTQPAFSPDGERIAFRSEREGGGIFVMGATGEAVKRLTDSGYNPAWSPDSKQLVYSTGWFWWATARTGSRYQLLVVDAGGASGSGGPRLITDKIEDAAQPSWSPHGRRIAFWSVQAGNMDIWSVPAAGGEPVRVTQEPSVDWNPVWSPDGKYLYFSSDRGGSMNLWRVRIEEDSGSVLGPAEPVTTPSADAAYVSFARDGRRMAYVNRLATGNIYRIDFDPVREAVIGQASPVTHGSWLASSPDVSPNGEWLVFATSGKPTDLYVIRTDGAGLRQLTDDDYLDRQPKWSPDGKRIAFYSNRGGGPSQIWTINPDGSGLRQLTRDPRGALYPVWSPDGSRLVYTVPDRSSTFTMDLGKPWEQGSVETLPPSGQQNSSFTATSWSSDGRRLAGDPSSGGISVYSFDSRQYEHFTDFGYLPRWLSDSRRLVFFTFATTSKSAMYLLDTRSRKVREILSVTPNEIRLLAPSHDDRRIYFGLGSIEADVWLMSLK